mmetsp:Transcript_20879/g.32240  ORF Transcript_20879/g.32240 Transcript_20879/m.32240 type:complete len:89 (-) Transcript_20879:5540-5806(-)
MSESLEQRTSELVKAIARENALWAHRDKSRSELTGQMSDPQIDSKFISQLQNQLEAQASRPTNSAMLLDQSEKRSFPLKSERVPRNRH